MREFVIYLVRIISEEMVIVNPNDTVPLAQSPSITQETKARFNELLKAALSKEASLEPQIIKSSANYVSKKQSVSIPKVVPRRKLPVKSPKYEESIEKFGAKFSTYSSEDSSGHRERQIIAEVHSSRTQLLQSSSEDDILAEKKTKKKKKKSRWKQVSESAQLMKDEEQDNPSFQMDEEAVDRSPSRSSNRSYILETPTIPVENLISVVGVNDQSSKTASPSHLTSKSYVIETSTFTKENLECFASRSDFGLDKDDSNCSPSRLSNRSYTIEIPTVPLEILEKDETSTRKTPIPLPRRKSLKSPETEQVKNTEFGHLPVERRQSDTVITIFQSNIDYVDDLETPRSDIKFQDYKSQLTEDDEEMPIGIRKQKRKKKRRKRSKSREEIELQEMMVLSENKESRTLTVEESKSTPSVKSLIEAADMFERKTTQSPKASEGIVGVTIHGVDCPLIDPLVRHPMVCVYVVDTSVGELYRKSDPARSVCYHGENTSYILPIMTHLFDFKQRKSVTPAWEECLLLNEPLSHLLTPPTLLLFELCDVVPAAVASARHARLGGAAGRHVVAWAFLRPVASGSRPPALLSLRLRLQLYKPGQPRNTRPLTPAVYEWWGSAARAKYPGSLYVTVSQLDSPAAPAPSLRSQSALQAERGSQASASAAGSAMGSDLGEAEELLDQETTKPPEVQWSRLPGQSCKVPNACVSSLPVEGSMSVQFSSNGLWLACGRQEIQVYSVPQFTHTTTLTGHQGLVYCLRWSADSKVLLSASADCTVCVWRPLSSRNPLLQMLAHPSFVYCAQFVRSLVLVSGCCDTVLRVWRGGSHGSYQLAQELSGLSGFVTSVCTTVDGSRVISADSLGCLRVYDVEDDGSLSAARELRVREVRGIVISNVIAHPGGHRLLVHSRDSTVRSVDLATGAVLQTFKGCSSERMQTGMSVSACGSLVLACGEDGALVVWDGHTGALRAVYCGILPPGSAGVHYHPHDHLVAAVGLAQPPLYILGFDRNATGEDIGLHMLKNEITAANVIETMKLIKNSNKWQKAASKILHKPHSSINATGRGIGKDKRKKTKSGNNGEASGKQTQSAQWPSLPQLECFIDKSSGEKDLRLLEIIRKMDNIILAAKQSSQVQQ